MLRWTRRLFLTGSFLSLLVTNVRTLTAWFSMPRCPDWLAQRWACARSPGSWTIGWLPKNDLEALYASLGMGREISGDTLHSVCNPDLPNAGEVWQDVLARSNYWLEQMSESM